MNTPIQIGQTVEVTRKRTGTMQHIMYLERKSESDFVVKPKWEGGICFLMEDHKHFTDESSARRWAGAFA